MLAFITNYSIFAEVWLSDEQKVFIGELMPLNVEARYPSYKQSIGESLSEKRCKELLTKTKEVQQWVKTML